MFSVFSLPLWAERSGCEQMPVQIGLVHHGDFGSILGEQFDPSPWFAPPALRSCRLALISAELLLPS
jgi:hypothetical protein